MIEGLECLFGHRNGQMEKVKIEDRDFAVGSGVKNPPCNAGDVDLIPVQGTKIPHTEEQLSSHVTSHS